MLVPLLIIASTISLTIWPAIAHAHESHPDLRHWETASADPDRIFLSFYGDPATSRAVTWRTRSDIKEAAAEIAVATNGPMFDESALRIPAKTETVDLNLHTRNSQGKVNYHSVHFTDLQPDTLYAYRVGSDGYWSEWIQFRTATTEPEPFSFVYFGDAQNDILDKWSRVIRMSFQKAPEASLAIHAGDLVNNGHFDNEWGEWFKAGGWIHSQRTGIPAVGNHEIRPFPDSKGENLLSILWRPQFMLPEEPLLPDQLQETVYTVDYQGVRFIVMNSYVEDAAQARYLRTQLERPGADWTVVISHYSIFSPRPGRQGYPANVLWQPIIEEFGVDLVLQGHDHLYARGHVPVRTADGEFGESFNTMYVTSVSGSKQYKIDQASVAAFSERGYQAGPQAEQKQFFQVIEVEADRLTYTAYTADGEVFDRAVITKDRTSGTKTIR